MNKILLTMLMINSIMFYSSKTPMSMGMMLIIQTILITLISGMMSFNFWFTYILFLIMVGGLLILFIYMSSLSPNQKFFINKKFLMLNSILLMMMLLIIFNMKMFMNYNSDIMNFMNMETEQFFFLKMSLNKLYNKPTNMIMIMLINYLLLSLFIIVKIIYINKGPLRKNF
nr:NADH dehydrogenase subunit 6 [Tomostethus sp. 1 QHW-2022a]UTY22595.1 NADH dehydrogenase subunit 6 [Tomostethus sp. 1 QHW-2022a]